MTRFILVGIALSFLSAQAKDIENYKPVKLSDKAKKLHGSLLVADGHNDLPWALRKREDMDLTKRDLRKHQEDMHTDIPRLRQGNVGMQFWSAYVPASTMHEGTAVRETLEQIDLIRRMVAKYSDTFEMADTTEDIRRITKAGRIASMIGVEGGYSIDSSLGVLRSFYDLGVRYMTLTHSKTINWADSATDMSRNNGLTDYGKKIVGEMNRLGMLVDISHVSAKTMRDAIEHSRAPVIASHSSAYALAPHDRNVPDDILRLLKKKDGVVMVNFYSAYVDREAADIYAKKFDVERELMKKYKKKEDFDAAMDKWRADNPIPRGSVRTIVDHIDHIAKIAGIERVGMGSDYDGVPVLPHQLEDVSKFPYITQEMLNRGYGEAQIRLVMGGNLMRVLGKAEQVSRSFSAAH